MPAGVCRASVLHSQMGNRTPGWELAHAQRGRKELGNSSAHDAELPFVEDAGPAPRIHLLRKGTSILRVLGGSLQGCWGTLSGPANQSMAGQPLVQDEHVTQVRPSVMGGLSMEPPFLPLQVGVAKRPAFGPELQMSILTFPSERS